MNMETAQQSTATDATDRAPDTMTGGAEGAQAKITESDLANALRDAQAKLALLEARLAESQSQQAALETLYRELAPSRDELALTEVEQVLVLANSGTRALSSVLQNVIDAWRRVAGLALPTPGGGACHPLTESATLRLSAEVRIRAVVCDLQISRALRSQRVKQSPEMPHPQGDHWESSNGECGDAQKGRTHP